MRACRQFVREIGARVSAYGSDSDALTADEITEREAMAVEAEAQRVADEEAAQALADLKTSARAKLVAGEPLTEAEAATLVI